MAEEKNWDGFWPASQDFLYFNDYLMVRKANGAAVQTSGHNIVARRASGGAFDAPGRIIGGFGAETAGGGVDDWNHASNAVAGSGFTLLSPAAANAPPYSDYCHAFSFEYGTKDGSGNLTQFAIPYYQGYTFFGLRTRYVNEWSPWLNILTENVGGQYLPSLDNVKTLGASTRRFAAVYAGSGSINTSDERQKTDIGPISDEWLDAWGDVEWSRFRFKDGKRWHVGLIAQRVHAAFAARGLDAFDIGLCCFDAWEEEQAPVLGDDGTIQGKGEVTRPAGDLWGLRYDECFAMEAAWLRRELAMMRKGE